MPKLFSLGYTRFEAPKNMPTSGAWLGPNGQGTVDDVSDGGSMSEEMNESESLQSKIAKAENLEHIGWGKWRFKNYPDSAIRVWNKSSNKFVPIFIDKENEPKDWHEEKFVKNLEHHILGMGFKEEEPHKFSLTYDIIYKDKVKQFRKDEEDFLNKLEELGYREKHSGRGIRYIHNELPNILYYLNYDIKNPQNTIRQNVIEVETNIELDESLNEVASTVAPTSVATGQFPARQVVMARRDRKTKKFKDHYIAFKVLHTLDGLKTESEQEKYDKHGYTTYDDDHAHKYIVDENGDGKTTSTTTYEGKSYPDHVHKIENFKVKIAGKHPHKHGLKE